MKFFFLICITPHLFAMESERFIGDFSKLVPKEIFLRICAAPIKTYEYPWEALPPIFDLQLVCVAWQTLIANNQENIATLLHIPLMHWAAATGNTDVIIGLKLAKKYSVKEPDERMFSPSEYAFGMKKKASIRTLFIGDALKKNQIFLPEPSDSATPVHEYTSQDIIDALKGGHSAKLETILSVVLKDRQNGMSQLLNLSWDQVSSWNIQCTNYVAYAIVCNMETTLFECIGRKQCPEDLFKAFEVCSANPNTYDFEGFTPLHRSCTSPEKFWFVEELLKCNAIDVNCFSKHVGQEGVTPLHVTVTCQNPNPDALKALLAIEKCNINAMDAVYGTPLHCAVNTNDNIAIKLLIDHKANIYSRHVNHCNATPIHNAAQHESTDALSCFFAIPGCPVDIQDVAGRTPIWYAVQSDRNACMQYLMHRKADTSSLTNTRKTSLLLYAIENNSINCFSTLLTHLKHTIHYTDKTGHGALHWVAKSGNVSFLQPLIDAGALVNVADTVGDTPMHYAASRGYHDIIADLFEHRADVNSTNKPNVYFGGTKEHAGKYTPIHFAAYKGHFNAVKTLVQCNADITAQTQLGKTALDIAKESGHIDIVDFLTSAEQHKKF